MADDAQYEYTSAQAIRGTEAKMITKWAKDGWEVDSRNQGLLRTELTFRRVKPKTLGSRVRAAFSRLEPKAQRGLLAAAAGVLVLLVVSVGVVVGMQAEGGTPVLAASATEAGAAPSEKPSEGAVQAPEATTPADPTIASPAPPAPNTPAPAPVAPKPQTPAPVAPKPQAPQPQAPAPAPAPQPVAPSVPDSPAVTSTFFKNCSAARAAGAAPVRLGDAGYGSHLDTDGDGVGCE